MSTAAQSTGAIFDFHRTTCGIALKHIGFFHVTSPFGVPLEIHCDVKTTRWVGCNVFGFGCLVDHAGKAS